MAPGWYRGERLGKGGFGEVFEAVPFKTGPLMAVKSAPEREADSLFRERHFLQKLAGVPGIVRCYGGEFTGENPTRTFNLLLEYAHGGSLSDLIRSYRFGMPEGHVRVFTRSLLKALNSIHSRRWAHCDIKPSNILVFPPPPATGGGSRRDYELKIADFGLAADMSEGIWDFRGTVRYMPPETVNFKRVSPAMDVWALGCTVLEMLTGDRPWKGWSSEDKRLKVEIGKGSHPVIPCWLSKEAKDFLRMCFEKSSFRRPNCADLLRHPFVAGVETPRRPVSWWRRMIPQHICLPHLMLIFCFPLKI